MPDWKPLKNALHSSMNRRMTLNIRHPEYKPESLIQGFRFFWAFYVDGFRDDKHCQPCFKGKRVDEFCTATARSGQSVTLDLMDRYKYVYVCGVASGPKSERGQKNFHWALGYQEGNVIGAETYNGYSLTAHNAVKLDFPELPPGWNGLALETTRCKNFQFAVAYFGYPPATQ